MPDRTEIPVTPDLVHGAVELEPTVRGLRPHRLPAWARARGDAQLAMAEAQTSGVRLVVRTRTTALELDTLRTRVGYDGVGMRPEGIYDLLVDGLLVGSTTGSGGDILVLDPATGAALGLPALGL